MVMKKSNALLSLFLILSISSLCQIKGLESYIPSNERSFEFERQYMIKDETYEFIIPDGIDARISPVLFDSIWSEMERIFKLNGVSIPKGVVLGREYGALNISGTKESILKAIRSKGQFIMFEFELKDGYYVCINLQDDFCGLEVSKNKGSVVLIY